ncbi:MAG TPA: acyltransferase [Caulobacteraceae bacterium]
MRPPPLLWVQALRGLAALSVVVYHAFQWLGDSFWIGAAGVDVFFVISGFIIWTVGSETEAAPGVFLWRRVTRVAPAYWVMTGLTVALAVLWPTLLRQVSLSPAHIALSLAFVQHIDPRGLPFPVLPPGWSLNYEAVFYGLFTLVLFAPARLRFRLILAALVVVMVFGVLNPPFYYLGANPMLLQFAAGVCLARRRQLGCTAPRVVTAGLIVLSAGLVAAQALAGLQSDLWRPLLWGVPAALLVAGFVELERMSRRKPWRALLWLGDASYAIYLSHFIAVAIVAWLVGVDVPWVFVPAAVALSLAAGLAFHRWVEAPLIAGCRALPALVSPRRPSGAAAES